MCVLLGPEVILNNAFSAKASKQVSSIEFCALRNFCNIVYNKITENKDIRSKYVYLQVDEVDLEEFCEAEGLFARGIDRIYMTQSMDRSLLLEVNSMYSEEIQQSLREAREAFASA